MKKIFLLLVSVILLISSYFLINQLQISSFGVFHTISAEEVEIVKKTRMETEEAAFTALVCNEIRVPFDDVTNTFFVPLDMENETWEQLQFTSGQPEYQILFTENVTDYDKKEVIAENMQFDLIVYDNEVWANYSVVFSGLPIIDLATNEGFYAAENITGNAVFYDVDFLTHGTESSEYNGHIRGNTSREFPKKGYKINLTRQDGYGATVQNKISLFDMRKDEDWILYAIYNDDTKLRDKLSMEVWDRIGAREVSEKGYYGPRMTYVEVFADNAYCGLYGLMEPVDRKQLDIAAEDYSYKRKEPGGIKYQYNDFIETTDPYAIVEGFEIKDGPRVETAWRAMADLSAVITLPDEEQLGKDWDIINEDNIFRMWVFLQVITGHDHTAKNVFYVARYDDELDFNYQFSFAPWDMDLTWGNVSVGEINPYYTDFEMDTFDNRVSWDTVDWMLDLDYHNARERVLALYQEFRETVLTDEEVQGIIEELDHEVRDSGAFARDQMRWPEGIHAKDSSVLSKYAKERLNYLDLAIRDFDYFEE